MKKLLLGSTMLVAAALSAAPAYAQAQRNAATSAAPFSVNLRGYSTFAFQIANHDRDADLRSHDMLDDTRLTVNVEARSDNGLTYGFMHRLRLVPAGSRSDFQNDRNFLYLRSASFGEVILGTHPNAVDNSMAPPTLYGPATGLGVYADGGFAEFAAGSLYAQAGTARLTYGMSKFSGVTATQVMYTTPTFSGFSFSASYSADSERGRSTDRNERQTSTGSTEIGNAGTENLFAAALNYSGSFSGIGIGAGVGVNVAGAKDRLGGLVTNREYENVVGWTFRLSATYAGFTLYGNYAYDGDSGYAKRLASEGAAVRVDNDSAYGYNIGLGYVTGPIAVGVSYGYGKTEGDVLIGGDDTLSVLNVGGHYTLVPGLMLFGGVEFFSAKNEGAKQNDGTVITLGTHLRF
ncbi:MAG: porin [Alphaproteobacteria bacterium]|nr:MAG: porin [Alphaproteobacteria bacterium]